MEATLTSTLLIAKAQIGATRDGVLQSRLMPAPAGVMSELQDAVLEPNSAIG